MTERATKGTISFSELKRHVELPEPKDPPASFNSRFTPATEGLKSGEADQFGDIIHRTIDRGAGCGLSSDEWQAEARRLVVAEDAMSIVTSVVDVIGTLGPAIDEQGKIIDTEVDFSVAFGEWILTGQIDLLVYNPTVGRLRIVDLKTGRVKRVHPLQLFIYTWACLHDNEVAAVCPIEPTDAEFCLVGEAGTTVSQPVELPGADEGNPPTNRGLADKIEPVLTRLSDPVAQLRLFTSKSY